MTASLEGYFTSRDTGEISVSICLVVCVNPTNDYAGHLVTTTFSVAKFDRSANVGVKPPHRRVSGAASERNTLLKAWKCAYSGPFWRARLMDDRLAGFGRIALPKYERLSCE